MHSQRMSHTNIEITDAIPIACSLPAADYRQRMAETGQVARDALVDRRPIPGGARLTFEEIARVRRQLEAFIVAESSCCPFLIINLQSDGTHLVLDVTGPEMAAPIIEELFA
jgi:hypothetical protein